MTHGTILFLCTGNYYRSRFAEILFNSLSAEQDLRWRATSRGLRLSPRNPGPISPHAIRRLKELKIDVSDVPRGPLQVVEADLAGAHRIIALKEREHRQMLRERFDEWHERIDYWHIHDLDVSGPVEALAELETSVRRLAQELKPDGDY